MSCASEQGVVKQDSPEAGEYELPDHHVPVLALDDSPVFLVPALKPGGTLMLVEPASRDCVSDNINPVSRMYYAASTAVCTPCSKSQAVGLALGAQAGPARLQTILREAGFAESRLVAETPCNIVIEARAG